MIDFEFGTFCIFALKTKINKNLGKLVKKLIYHQMQNRSDKTSFVNIPRGISETEYFFAWVVLKMHHRHWPRINSQRRRGEAFFSDGRFLKFSLAPSEQIETLRKGHKLRLKRSDLIIRRNFN